MAALSCGEPALVAGPHAPVPASAPDLGKAADDVESGERQVEAAAGDCASACAGLLRMQGGRDVLCGQKAASCGEATKRTKTAETSVSSFCDPCGGS